MPVPSSLPVMLSTTEVRRCIKALQYVANIEAGQSQAPYLIEQEHTDEWVLAAILQERLNQKRKSKLPPEMRVHP